MAGQSGQLTLGFEPGTEYAVSIARHRLCAFDGLPRMCVSVIRSHFDVSAEKVTDLAGWQFDITFDPDVLEAVEVNEGDFLKKAVERPSFRRVRLITLRVKLKA